MDRKERCMRLIESSYNEQYKVIKGERIPGYLKKGWWGKQIVKRG